MPEMDKNQSQLRSPTCPDASQIAQLAEGTLNEPAFSLCLNHIEHCPHCEKILSLKITDPQFPKIVDDYRPSEEIRVHFGAELDSGAKSTVRNGGVTPFPFSVPEFASPEKPEDLGTIGRFRIQKLLFPGNIAYTYKAYDTKLNRTVAIKLLRPSLSKNPEWRQAFLSEAQTASALTSPYVIPIHHVDQFGDLTFFVMPFLLGETLAKKLKAGPMPLPQVASIALKILRAMEVAHQAGIVHRDIKPNNIWLKNDSATHELEPVLFDFGIASTTNYGLNSTGTKGYHSPEQSQGDIGDYRSDFFSFGCVLYEMTTGKMAFPPGWPQESIVRPLEDAAVPKTWLPLLQDLMALDPQKRPANHQEIRQKLQLLTKPEKKAWITSRWALSSFIAVVGIVVAGLAIFEMTRPTGLNPIAFFPSPGSNSLGPVVKLGPDGTIFRGLDNKHIIVNFPNKPERQIPSPIAPFDFDWSAPYLAVADNLGNVAILEIRSDFHKVAAVYSRQNPEDSSLSGLEWSKTEPSKLLVTYGNAFFLTQSENGIFPKALTPAATQVQEVANLHSARYRWLPQKGQVIGLMHPGGLTSIDLDQEKHNFAMRRFLTGPPMVCFTKNGSTMLAISPQGELAQYELGTNPTQNVITTPNANPYLVPSSVHQFNADIADAGLINDENLALRVPGDNRRPIRIYNLSHLHLPPLTLNTHGRRIVRMTVAEESGKIAALAADHSVMLFDCSKLR